MAQTTDALLDRPVEESAASPELRRKAKPLRSITERQRAVLVFIENSIAERGFPPTLREIGSHMQIRSTNGVNDHLRALERKGYIVRDDLHSRAIRVVSPSNEAHLRYAKANNDLVDRLNEYRDLLRRALVLYVRAPSPTADEVVLAADIREALR